MDNADISTAYRIEHRTPAGVTVVRQVVEPDRLATTSMVSRVFQEILAGFQARGEPGRLVMIEEDTGREVEAATIPTWTGSEP